VLVCSVAVSTAFLFRNDSVAHSANTGKSPAAACVGCHSEAKWQPNTAMADALETVETCGILIDHPVLSATLGKYSYRIEREGNQSSYSVTDGKQTVSLPIRWALGSSSSFGQTYILEKDGRYLESRVSYFRELNGLGPTLGTIAAPTSLDEAAGRPMSHAEELLCFGCHATGAAAGLRLTLDKMIGGVQCSRCHRGVEVHLAAALVQGLEQQAPKELTQLDSLSTEEISDFCGQCHRTWAEVAVQPPSIANIRFQPYRLTSSKCYDSGDPRISCLACHDPHHQVSSNSVDYDSKCLACHGGRKPGAKTCKVEKKQCVTCHMPKLELPGAHHRFCDHRIRIVRPNEPYPG
jgi:hypothetical protein